MYLLPNFLYRNSGNICISMVVLIFLSIMGGLYFGMYYLYKFNGFVGVMTINATRLGMNDYGITILFAMIGFVTAIIVLMCVIFCQCKGDEGSVWIMLKDRLTMIP